MALQLFYQMAKYSSACVALEPKSEPAPVEPKSMEKAFEPVGTRSKDAGLTTRSKKLLGTKGIATRSKDATRQTPPPYKSPVGSDGAACMPVLMDQYVQNCNVQPSLGMVTSSTPETFNESCRSKDAIRGSWHRY